MKLRESYREVFGNDSRAINRHSYREYESKEGDTIGLDRTLDGCPPFFAIHGPMPPGFAGVVPVTEVEGQEYWGDGWSWKRAVAKMCEVLDAEIVEDFT